MKENIFASLVFAANAHKGQKRKFDKSPYINHLLEVVNILTYAGIDDETVLAAASLHDIVEDTTTSVDVISCLFGKDVASLVEALSDDKALSIEERTAFTKYKIANDNTGFLAIKLADLISNISALPPYWDCERRDKYLSRCNDLLAHYPTVLDTKLQCLMHIARFLLEAQTEGSASYVQICDWACEGQLSWCTEIESFVVIEQTRNELGYAKGFYIQSHINTLFELGLLRGIELDKQQIKTIEVAYALDDNLDVNYVEHKPTRHEVIAVKIQSP